MRDGTERVWAFPRSEMSSLAEVRVWKPGIGTKLLHTVDHFWLEEDAVLQTILEADTIALDVVG